MIKQDTLDDLYDSRNNFFDFLRFFLAVIVIYSHSFVLLNGANNGSDPFVSLTNNQISGGTLAVYSFFVISGFLIMQSMSLSSSFIQYLKNRILRIFPAFFISLFLVSFIMGPLLTNLTLLDYFSSTNNGPFEFAFKNLTLNYFGYSWTVNDLFQSNVYPGTANGSMWTIKFEFAMYLILPLLNYFLIVKYKKLFALLTGLLCLLSAMNLLTGFALIDLVGNQYWVLSANEYNNFIQLAPYFMMGSLLFLYKDKIIVHNRLIFLTVFIISISVFTVFFKIVLLFTLPYLIITTAIKLRFSSFRKYGDFSYGMYIYAFPIQQLLSMLFHDHLNITIFFIASTLLTLFLAILSWHFVEKKALKLKSYKLKWKSNRAETF